jgi:hypothetical protein
MYMSNFQYHLFADNFYWIENNTTIQMRNNIT